MRLGVSLAGFAAAAETTNVAGRAAGLGSQAGRPGLGSVWFAQMASYDALAVASAVGRAVSPDLRRHRGGADLSPAPADTRVCG
jgi:hypothetical protein